MSDDIAAIKERLNIVDVVQRYVPKLQRAGRNYKGNCPFHQEKTPSFIINPELQRYKCFGCGEGGDVITFLQKIERLEFNEALHMAAEMAGYTLQQRDNRDNPQDKLRQRILEANRLATEFWHYILMTHKLGAAGRAYATKRGIRAEELKLFKMGFAPQGDNLCTFLEKRGFNRKELIEFGLAVEMRGQIIDKFRARFMLPIYSLRGEAIGFSGRIIVTDTKAPKYLNSPETLVYKKSNILMGLYQAKDAARQERTLILEEGNLDLMASHKVGIAYIAATGGTALTLPQLKLVQRYADTVLFAFDSDTAGRKALIHGLELAESIGLSHKVIDLATYQDPDAMVAADPELWKQAVHNPRNTLEHLLNIMQRDYDLGTADGKSALLKAYLPILKVVHDVVQQQHFAQELALLVGVATDKILNMLEGRAVGLESESDYPTSEPEVEYQSSGSKDERYLLALLCSATDVAALDIEPEVFYNPTHREIFQLLLMYPTPGRNYSAFTAKLSAPAQKVVQEVLMLDVEATADTASRELGRILNKLRTLWLDRRILEVGAEIQKYPDRHHELLPALQELSKRKRKLTTHG